MTPDPEQMFEAMKVQLGEEIEEYLHSCYGQIIVPDQRKQVTQAFLAGFHLAQVWNANSSVAHSEVAKSMSEERGFFGPHDKGQ